MTAFTTLPLSTRILITVEQIFENVENIDERRGSSVLGAGSSLVGSSDNIVPRGTATASACSLFVNGFNSLMMHPMTVGDPSKAWASSGSATYIFAMDSSLLSGGGWASSWISTSRAHAGRVVCRGEGH